MAVKKAGVGLVRAYQRGLSPYLPPACMYTPVCSQYAVDSIRRHGLVKGCILAAWRIARCNPFSSGGPDPTPAPGMWSNPTPPVAEKSGPHLTH